MQKNSKLHEFERYGRTITVKDLTAEQVVSYAAQKSYEKHVVQKGEFVELGIKTKEQFAEHISKTLKDKETKAIKVADGRKLYYNEKSNTMVWQNDVEPKRSGCYRPEEKKKRFDKTVKDELSRMGIDQAQAEELVKDGGHAALHEVEKEVEREETLTEKLRRQGAEIKREQQERGDQDKGRENDEHEREL